MKLPGYDAWLERPYQEMWDDHDRFERYAERYMATDRYEQDRAEWLVENPDSNPDDYPESDWFADKVRELMEADGE